MLRTHSILFALIAAGANMFAVAQEEVVVSAKTDAVALFKNGYAVVWREIEIPESGVYRWEDVPAVIHGTFYIESDMEVEVRTTLRTVSVPVDAKNPPKLAPGQMVTVRFSTPSGEEELTGRIVETTRSAGPNSLLPGLSRANTSYYDHYYGDWVRPAATGGISLNSTIVLESPDGKHLSFLTGQNIRMVTTHEPVSETMARRPVMVFDAKKEGGGGGKIRFVYLTKGATWAPNYRVNILDKKRLGVELATVVRNEGVPIAGAEVSLVSGFPNIGSANVMSPITPSQTLELFFRQVVAQDKKNKSGRNDDDETYMSQIMQQESYYEPPVEFGFDTAEIAVGEGPDIHYTSIGKRTLEVGETLSLTVGRGETEYRRVLECDLQDTIRRIGTGWQKQLVKPDVFEVLKFPNPLPFPMTTAPVTVMENSRFLGQSQTGWVNPQQIASVKITKALNVLVTCAENAEEAKPREAQEFRSGRHIKYDITGTVEIVNRRGEQITLHLNGGFMGKYETSGLAPVRQRVSPLDYWPNEFHELFWEITLEPGETKTIEVKGWRWVRN